MTRPFNQLSSRFRMRNRESDEAGLTNPTYDYGSGDQSDVSIKTVGLSLAFIMYHIIFLNVR